LNFLESQDVFEDLHNITFKQWVHVDCTSFFTLVESAGILRPYLQQNYESFSATFHLHLYLKGVKLHLSIDSVACIVDFPVTY